MKKCKNVSYNYTYIFKSTQTSNTLSQWNRVRRSPETFHEFLPLFVEVKKHDLLKELSKQCIGEESYKIARWRRVIILGLNSKTK